MYNLIVLLKGKHTNIKNIKTNSLLIMVIIRKNFFESKWRYAKMKGQIEQKDIAFILKKLRKDSGLTQQDLADKLFCDIRQIRRYETEGTEKLSVINLYASIFNISSIGILSASASLDAF